MRTEDCREKIDSAAKACNLEEKTVLKVKQAAGVSDRLKESFPQICGMATDAVLELGKRQNKAVLDKVIPELKKKIDTGKRPTKREVTEIITSFIHEDKKAVPQPVGKYRTIVIDPPWDIKKIIREVRPNQQHFDYPTMGIEEIKKTEIPADEEAHIYLWTTQKYLPESFEILKAWGFNYIFTMVWHKPGGFQPVGLPQYNCEFVLFGKKGSLPFEDTKAFNTCFSAPRKEHSRKPDEFYDLVRRVSPGPRIDMFSREKREGFEQWGNEITKFVGGETPAIV